MLTSTGNLHSCLYISCLQVRGSDNLRSCLYMLTGMGNLRSCLYISCSTRVCVYPYVCSPGMHHDATHKSCAILPTLYVCIYVYIIATFALTHTPTRHTRPTHLSRPSVELPPTSSQRFSLHTQPQQSHCLKARCLRPNTHPQHTSIEHIRTYSQPFATICRHTYR